MDIAQQPHEHNTRKFFDDLVKEADSQKSEKEPESPSQLLNSDIALRDKYDSECQKEHTYAITAILNSYKESYHNKTKFQERYRIILFWGCSGIIVIFMFAVLYVLRLSVMAANDFSVPGVITIVTGILSLIVSILELVHIITKYCFPENDEEYIINIVKSIQEHDLEIIKETNRASEAKIKKSETGANITTTTKNDAN